MHALPKTASLRTYQLDLVFLNAALQAGNQTDLATGAQTELNAIKHERLELERAEELEMVAAATVAAHNVTLGTLFKSTAAHVRAHHPGEYDHFFPKTPSRVTESALRDELQATRTLARQLAQLPAGDPVRVEFESALTAAADHLEESIGHKDEVLQGFALVRANLDRVRARVNLKRIEIHGTLLTRLKDKALADKFFRPNVHKTVADDATPTTAPATA